MSNTKKEHASSSFEIKLDSGVLIKAITITITIGIPHQRTPHKKSITTLHSKDSRIYHELITKETQNENRVGPTPLLFRGRFLSFLRLTTKFSLNLVNNKTLIILQSFLNMDLEPDDIVKHIFNTGVEFFPQSACSEG